MIMIRTERALLWSLYVVSAARPSASLLRGGVVIYGIRKRRVFVEISRQISRRHVCSVTKIPEGAEQQPW